MGKLVFSHNLTLDGCIDHREGIADEVTHAYFTRFLSGFGAILWGRTTYEMMESYWPAVAQGHIEAPPVLRDLALVMQTLPKYVCTSTRSDFWWENSYRLAGELGPAVRDLKRRTEAGVLLGSGRLANELERLGLIDEYRFLIHPVLAGHGPKLYPQGLASSRQLRLVSSQSLGNGVLAVHYARASSSASGA